MAETMRSPYDGFQNSRVKILALFLARWKFLVQRVASNKSDVLRIRIERAYHMLTYGLLRAMGPQWWALMVSDLFDTHNS